MTFRFAINTLAIQLVLPYVCTEETRYHLWGVHIERSPDKGLLAVATNGLMCGMAYDPDAVFDGDWPEHDVMLRLPRSMKAELTPSRRKCDRLLVAGDAWYDNHPLAFVLENMPAEQVIDQAGPLRSSALALCSGSHAVDMRSGGDGKYPDWRSACFKQWQTNRKPVQSTSFDAELLEIVCRGFKRAFSRREAPGGIMPTLGFHSNEIAPTILRFDTGPHPVEFAAVLMPCRMSEPDTPPE